MADWGYNRDGKKDKMQVVVGLLTGPDGFPVAVRVFEGNTNDTKTVAEQIKILTEKFKVKTVTLVGDRGMLRGPQIESLPAGFNYISAISKPEIAKMLAEGTLQYDLFDEQVAEVEIDKVRYILRRNPVRADQIEKTREQKWHSICKLAKERTEYLSLHPKAIPEKALEKVQDKICKLKADKWLKATLNGRVISIEKDDKAEKESSLLDGCYVIKSDLKKNVADAQTLHDRYCDLEKVERNFRTMKTAHMEMRPIFVRKKTRTKAHAFIVMLGLILQRELEKYWCDLDITVEEGLRELATIPMEDIVINETVIQNIPLPTKLGQQLLKNAKMTLPTALPKKSPRVHTKKKLQKHRKKN